ncbi:MAG TPA: hypothetical protein VE974_29280 [Thermoanaerobaculia bacterium]|nr:hypothetical protein [Thermoanaerobaculia bacterium]
MDEPSFRTADRQVVEARPEFGQLEHGIQLPGGAQERIDRHHVIEVIDG